MALFDQFGQPLESGPMAAGLDGAPYMPDGAWNYGFYDAVNYSANRAARPFFAVDSRYTLTAWTYLRALSLARWSYINVAPVKGAVDLMARLAVGTGFAPQTACADEGLARAADEYYEAETRNIGFMAGESIDELLLHDSRSVDVDGDKLDIFTEDEFGNARLQFIEGHRIRNGSADDPHCRNGVWVDDYGRRIGYQVSLPGDDPDSSRRIDAYNCIYLAERNRPDETRSVTNLIHALAPLQDLYEILNFAMISAKRNTEIAAVIQTNTPDDPPGMGARYQQIIASAANQAAQGATPSSQVITREQIWASGGKVVVLRPNESFKSYNNQQPNPQIETWAEFVIRLIAVGFGVPFEILWNPEAIGGANTRLITALLRQRLIQRRTFVFFPKLSRVRFWLNGRAVKKRIFTPKQFAQILPHTWQPKFSDVTIDAGRESRERRANVLSGLDTHTGYYMENGESYLNAALPTRERDVTAQCAAAERIIKAYEKLDFTTALLLIAGAGQGGATIRDTSQQEEADGTGDKKQKEKSSKQNDQPFP